MAAQQTRNAHGARGPSGYLTLSVEQSFSQGEGPGPTETKPAIFDR